MHKLHVGVGVFSRCLGIMLCCVILLSFLKDICKNHRCYWTNSKVAVVSCLCLSSSITIGSGFSFNVRPFRLDIVVV